MLGSPATEHFAILLEGPMQPGRSILQDFQTVSKKQVKKNIITITIIITIKIEALHTFCRASVNDFFIRSATNIPPSQL